MSLPLPHGQARFQRSLGAHSLATGLLAALLASCTADSDTLVLKLGHGLDTSHPVHHALVEFADEVAARSAGGMRVDVYPAEQLGSERELLELLQIGSLALTKVSASVLESFAPAYQVFSLPYLFSGDDHLWRVLEGEVGRELLVAAEPYRLRGLAYYDAGARSFYTRSRPVLSPSDLGGLKIRTQESATMIRAVRELGGSATPISWGELYTALQQGVVDGAENNPPSFHLSRHYEVCRHYSLDEHTLVPDVLVIGTATWERLDGAQRRVLEEAAAASVVVQRRLWSEATEHALREVELAGVQIHRPDKAPFAARVASLLEEYRSNPLLGPYLERIAEAGAIP
ncbi:MAG TPA: TRAP transporter substrate-binding protein [Thermoanaerobaculia bacterium]|nr:TRAP transporter substrate-binding protein [Thermoanaerobaculia bacterium]